MWNEALTVSPSLIGERTQNSEEWILGREMPGQWLAAFEPNGKCLLSLGLSTTVSHALEVQASSHHFCYEAGQGWESWCGFTLLLCPGMKLLACF